MSEQQVPQQMDRKDMKIQALKERMAEMTVNYEDRDADRRITITELMQERDQFAQQAQELALRVQELEPQTEPEASGETVETPEEVPTTPVPD